MAETEGFEPSVPVRGLHLSRACDVCRWCRSRGFLHVEHTGFGGVVGCWDPHGTLRRGTVVKDRCGFRQPGYWHRYPAADWHRCFVKHFGRHAVEFTLAPRADQDDHVVAVAARAGDEESASPQPCDCSTHTLACGHVVARNVYDRQSNRFERASLGEIDHAHDVDFQLVENPSPENTSRLNFDHVVALGDGSLALKRRVYSTHARGVPASAARIDPLWGIVVEHVPPHPTLPCLLREALDRIEQRRIESRHAQTNAPSRSWSIKASTSSARPSLMRSAGESPPSSRWRLNSHSRASSGS